MFTTARRVFGAGNVDLQSRKSPDLLESYFSLLPFSSVTLLTSTKSVKFVPWGPDIRSGCAMDAVPLADKDQREFSRLPERLPSARMAMLSLKSSTRQLRTWAVAGTIPQRQFQQQYEKSFNHRGHRGTQGKSVMGGSPALHF